MNSINNLAYPVVDHCNLNCRGCCRFCNSLQEKHFADIKIFEKDLKRFKELVENIEMFRLFGGEPLLHPDLDKFVYIARKYYPYSEIDIVSNGLLIDRMPPQLIEAIKSCYVKLEISVYKPTRAKMQSIMNTIDEYKLGYTLNNVDKFWKRFNMAGDSIPEAMWQDCEWKKCNGLRDGKFMMCPLPIVIKEFNKMFDFNYNFDNEVLDIYDDSLTFEDIKDFINRPHDYCAYCGRPEFIKWHNGGKAQIEDYAVKYFDGTKVGGNE